MCWIRLARTTDKVSKINDGPTLLRAHKLCWKNKNNAVSVISQPTKDSEAKERAALTTRSLSSGKSALNKSVYFTNPSE